MITTRGVGGGDAISKRQREFRGGGLGLGQAFPRIRLPAMQAEAPAPSNAPGLNLIEPEDRLQFERLLLALRLTFVGMALLPLLAFGPEAIPYALLIAAAAIGSCALIWLLVRRYPNTLLRYQLGLRLLDCGLVYLVLLNYHGFLGNAYYDIVYLLFVVAAAATHGRRGALSIGATAGLLVLVGRLQLMAGGLIPYAPRHLTDGVFYLAFFLTVGVAITFLMRRSSEVVERRERVWRAVLQQMPAGVAIAEAPSGRLLLGNEQFEHILGHPFLPVTGIAHYQQYRLYYPDGRPYQPEEMPLARAIRTGEVIQAEEMEAVRPDGTRATVQVGAAPIRDRAGRIVAGVVTFYDVTWRKRAEEAQRFLAEASKELASSLDYESTFARLTRLAVPTLADLCIIDVCEADGSTRRVAVAHVDPAKEALANALQERYSPDPKSRDAVPRVLRTGRSELTSEVTEARLRSFAQDAEHLRILRELGPRSSMNVPLVARGRTLGVMTFVTSESGRRYGPDDLALAEDLARRAAVALDNARLYQEAQAAIQVRDEFLSSASHDLKSPLVAVKGHAQLLSVLLTRESRPVSEQVAMGLSKIDAAASKMAALIDELLDVAHMQAGRPLALDRRPIDLLALAQQVVAEHQQLTSRHRLCVESSAPAVIGVWDSTRLDRVLANLLSNAIKYSPRGGTITVRVAREQDEAGARAVLAVQDQGLGIPAADLSHVFERFHRGGNVAGQIRGSGIGLAGVRQIVEQHGGSIDVDSQEGQGATFTVRLPLRPPSTAAAEGQTAPATPPAAPPAP